jgi:very-short-patch-repair endonuclease
MVDIDEALCSRGGLAHISELHAAGISRDSVRRAANRGHITAVRAGIYASTSAPTAVVRAARVGGRLAGASAARQHGLWAPESRTLVVEVSRSANTLRNPDDASQPLNPTEHNVTVLWRRQVFPAGQRFGLSTLEETLRQVAVTQPLPFAVATLDSALRRTPLSAVDLLIFAAKLDPTARRPFELADPRSDSGTESVLRVLLLLAGVDAKPQMAVPFTDLERVDLLIGDSLVVECDSAKHHGSREQRVRDLRRDAALACLGFVVLRCDYAQVFDEPETVVAAVLKYVSLGLHLGRLVS